MGQGFNYINSLPRWAGEKSFSLERIQVVLDSFSNPQDSYRSVHVAGTNGKGSTSVLIASIIGASGQKVGLTISPHLLSVNERIIVDGIPISNADFNRIALRVENECRRHSISLSQFEAIIVCAFLHFREVSVDFAVIETGLGGRLDATNVISKPDACVITSVGYDHQDILGSTLEEIAREKAGIFKAGVPIFVGETTPEVLSVLTDVARDVNAGPVAVSKREFGYHRVETSRELFVETGIGDAFPVSCNLAGSYQLGNITLAAALTSFLDITPADIQSGLAQAFWPGRFEEVEIGTNSLLMDAAHNEQGVQALLKSLKEEDQLSGFTMVFGALQTKNWRKMISDLNSLVEQWFIIEPDSEQAVAQEAILEFISSLDSNDRRVAKAVTGFGRDYLALAAAIEVSRERHFIAAGSIYMLGSLREALGIPIPPLWHRRKFPATVHSP